ncbi:MAG: carboxypeptidase regulatory-like domain-containing protein [Terriglobales bacterium]|jgi:tetratricopeptide (TPR) repeat protein
MKRRLILCVLAAMMAALGTPAAWGQFTSIKGFVHDVKGEPIVGATLQFTNRENGRKYEAKTNNKGEYNLMGANPGRHDLLVTKDGQELWKLTGVQITLDEKGNTVNVDLKKEQAAQQLELPPEVKKQQEEQQKEISRVKGLNDKLAQAKVLQDGGNPQQAAVILTEASQMDPSQPVIWAALAEAERAAAGKQTDQAEKQAAYTRAVEDYKKAIALKPTGSYYNNMGDAAARSGDAATAIASYAQAAQIDPQNAAMYYFNEGAVLTNTGKVDEASQAYDKAIQADPTKAEAYYQKAMNLLNKATLKGNKMEAPPGTEETLKKYLELQPTGEHAEIAKQMLEQLGATVETTFGKGKTPSKTKK